MGIHPNDENFVHDTFLANTEFDGTRYQVKLQFNDNFPVLIIFGSGPGADNFRNGVARLGSLLRCLKQDPDVFQEYNAIFMEQSAKGMIEDVPEKCCLPE